MTTNLYAPPVPSSDKSSVKRPFFKSGARILVAALIGRFVFTFGPYLLLFIADPMMMVSFMGAFQISSIQGVLVFPSLTKGIAAIFTSFIPIGAWLFGRTQQLTGRLLWLWWGAIAIALLHALLNWGQNIHLLLLLAGTVTEPMPLLVTLASSTKTLMGLGLASFVRQIATRGSSLPTRGLATAYILMILFEYGWSFFVEHPVPIRPGDNQWFLDNSIALGLAILAQMVLIAALWSARKLEDGPANYHWLRKMGKPSDANVLALEARSPHSCPWRKKIPNA